MFKWLVGNKIIAIAALALIASTGILARVAYQQHDKIVVLEHDAKDSMDTINQLSVEKSALSSAHKQCMDEVKVARGDQSAALSSLAALTERINKDATNVRASREIIYQKPGCKELSVLDIAASCPALATSLRISASKAR